MLSRGTASIVHIAGHGDHPSIEMLSRIAAVVGNHGVRQAVISLGGATEPWPTRPIAAEVSRLANDRLSVLGSIRALESEYAWHVGDRPPHAVHLHGLRACLLGLHALRRAAPMRLICSPSTTSFGRWWALPVLTRLLQAEPGHTRLMVLASSPTDAEALSGLLRRSAEALPQVVGERFFALQEKEDPAPRIVADGAGPRALDLVARLSVLFNAGEAKAPLAWLGAVEPAAKAKLEAANVQVLAPMDDGERANALSGAWLFIQASRSGCSADTVAKAMGAGLPCLVRDAPEHRALMRHDETGYVCTSEGDFAEKISLLLRDRAERVRLGSAARAEAERRFTWRHFETAVLRLYGLPPGGTARTESAPAMTASEPSVV